MSTFIVSMSFYFGFVLNFPVISEIMAVTASSHGGFFAYTSPLLLTCLFIIIFSALAIPYLFRPLFIFITLTSGAACFATAKYQVMFDYSMMENIFETNTSEAASYLSLSSFLYVFALGVVPSLLIAVVKIKKDKPLRSRVISRMAILAVAVVGIAGIAGAYYKDYVSMGRNNVQIKKMIVPAHIFNSVKYGYKKNFEPKLPYRELGDDATLIPAANGKPTLMVLVVGETARAMNFHYNGYARDTNPYTKGKGVVSLADVSSCGTSTAHSLPCMFSKLERTNYERRVADSQSNALDIIKKAGVSMTWVDNDGGDKDVAKMIGMKVVNASSSNKFCDGMTCYDEVLLEDFDKTINENQGDKLISLHTIGSHGPTYWKRYPAEMTRFTPTCDRSDIENCTDEEIVNTYDNTIAYTDYFLSKVIEKLESYQDKYNVAMMYISDHGESLGENGLYLHGTPYMFAPAEQTHVPWLIWMGDGYAEAKGVDYNRLVTRAKEGQFSHDNLFHSLIDFFGVETTELDKAKSVFN
ncbi:phosphoethanolamine transferase [Veronia nyctiphanis]|uniref:Phosphoethanolamine transferase n=1 Tax=Veronia nyctiphanis TaxID=1278244 RepID=A0A4Q0YUK7_9GAMM|nr:phosphoethanolamine transferase [Veronia nyctiphanis]